MSLSGVSWGDKAEAPCKQPFTEMVSGVVLIFYRLKAYGNGRAKNSYSIEGF